MHSRKTQSLTDPRKKLKFKQCKFIGNKKTNMKRTVEITAEFRN